jgi:hypothetical protein
VLTIQKSGPESERATTDCVMGIQLGVLFDPEAIDVMRQALDEAIAKLPADLWSTAAKVEMARCILKAASTGDRDLPHLRAAALLTAITRHRMSDEQRAE